MRYRAGGYYLTRVAFRYLARLAIPAAAVLMPTGFFLSSMDDGATAPNGLVVLLWLGAACLTVGVVSLGLALLLGKGTTDRVPEDEGRRALIPQRHG
ncbi:MAG TPA: hypothetical protein VHI50_14550 [Micromonosporaceae bacterium]|nr:hypothetical protein [Micromonosporaceae bacterium]